jgi:hypothetical protein
MSTWQQGQSKKIGDLHFVERTISHICQQEQFKQIGGPLCAERTTMHTLQQEKSKQIGEQQSVGSGICTTLLPK